MPQNFARDRLSLTYPDGKVVHYAYDLAARLAQVSDWLTQTTSYVYNPIGQPLTVTLPNGVTSSYGYDNAERLTGIHSDGWGMPVANWSNRAAHRLDLL